TAKTRHRVREGTSRLPPSTDPPSFRVEGMDRDTGGDPLLDPGDHLRIHRAHHTQAEMIPDEWSRGEIAVIGLGKSGIAASRLLVRRGHRVYASDSGSSPLMER